MTASSDKYSDEKNGPRPIIRKRVKFKAQVRVKFIRASKVYL